MVKGGYVFFITKKIVSEIYFAIFFWLWGELKTLRLILEILNFVL